jgi:hypothetical protein
MISRPIVAPLALALLLAGCGGTSDNASGEAASVATFTNDDAITPDANIVDANGVDSALPDATPSAPEFAPDAPAPAAEDRTPAAEVPATPDSAQAAATVVETYYALIETGKYREAWKLWGGAGQRSGKTETQFTAGFASTAATYAEVGAPGDTEGAAGSIFVDVPVTVNATLKDGTTQRFVGTYTLRRVNDVPGSSAEDRRWHIDSAKLRKVAAP